MSLLEKSACVYTPLFCEENIWKLIEALYMNHYAKPIDVLFILNQSNSIALFNQNKAEAHKPVIWDYHVVLSAEHQGNIVIFDFDSRCEFPQIIKHYFDFTFPVNVTLSANYQALIKPIKAEYFLKHFHSDRSHMSGIIGDSDYPAYQIITPEKNTVKLTLEQCRDTNFLKSASELNIPREYIKKIKN